MNLQKNIIANYIGTIATALAPILALPWYLEALGPEQFGLIGFVAMLQVLLGLLDAGMSQALVREITIRMISPKAEQQRVASLLVGFEGIYWGFAFTAGCFIALIAGIITTHWLKLENLPSEVGKEAIYGAAAIFAAQFPGSVYRSVLVGAQAQVTLNIIMFFSSITRHFGGVIIVLYFPTLLTYLIWHASIAMLETLLRGKMAWRTLNIKRSKIKWELKEMRPPVQFIMSMSGAALLGVLTVQMDRIVLSLMVTIEQFGYYTVAATVAVGMLQLIYPLVQAVLPRAIQLRADPIGLRCLSAKLAALIGLLAVLGALIFIAFGKWLLNFWLKSPAAVTAVYPILSVLLIGTILNAFYNVGYMNWIVHENCHSIMLVNSLALLLSVILIPWLVIWQGTIGAAFGWLAINLIGFFLSLEWIKLKQYDSNN
ncbi:conserved membrane hypothetical protein [Candidatus Methylobacter favarea]|uniref:Polysaccharide biosynthesis protein n=1 Tax=Candidatus Methylobacter favarea TaxID=2707345 RepID=A0A8S0XJP0_9GAMM|nr:oligosaccharide flippase family protein [Candidatus Methylobacter favarea]CAA9891480.1 conserved membrane hypothetical protein [Candidatus Methylobacter favarea]